VQIEVPWFDMLTTTEELYAIPGYGLAPVAGGADNHA
jgi:hypothetical protein